MRFVLSFVCLLALLGRGATAQTVTAEAPPRLSVVRVNVTNQPYDFGKPWSKRSPYTRRALGAVLAEGRVLVTGELVANSNYVEFEAPDGSRKIPAEVEWADYEANLAVLKTADPEFLKPFAPIELTSAKVGDSVAVWQLENNGTLLATKGTMTTAEVTRYPQDDSAFLIYRVTASLQARESSYSVPLVKENRLIGLLSRYDAQSSAVDVIPTPVIEHFLHDLAKPPYHGFPRAGMTFAPTRDPQLRRYAGLAGQPGGVYVTDITPGGPSDSAGLVKGDVILRVDDLSVDQDGDYWDPDYGRIGLSNLLSVRHFAGDAVKFTIWRKDTQKDLTVTLAHRSPQDYVIDPYIIDRAPKFYILGGLVLQELSRQYLREWGPDWVKKAPEELVYLEREQSQMYRADGRKIVFLSRVLPTDATVGYEELHHLVITRINDQEILHLSDVPSALGKSKNGLHKIEFDGDPSIIYLDAAQIATSDQALKKSYRLPSLQRLN